jgi:hypothetical protein
MQQQPDSHQNPLPGHPLRVDLPDAPARFSGLRPAPLLVGLAPASLVVTALLLDLKPASDECQTRTER